MVVGSGCSKSSLLAVMALAVLAPQESLTQDVPEPYSLDRITPADAQSDKITEEFSNKALDASRKLGPIEIDGRID